MRTDFPGGDRSLSTRSKSEALADQRHGAISSGASSAFPRTLIHGSSESRQLVRAILNGAMRRCHVSLRSLLRSNKFKHVRPFAFCSLGIEITAVRTSQRNDATIRSALFVRPPQLALAVFRPFKRRANGVAPFRRQNFNLPPPKDRWKREGSCGEGTSREQRIS